MQTTPTAHIHLDERGVAWIDDTNVKVVEVVLDKLAHGSSPEEIHFQHPHLSLAQIHAALSYYYDHQQEIDTSIEQQLRWVEAMAAQAGDSPIRQRLRALGKCRERPAVYGYAHPWTVTDGLRLQENDVLAAQKDGRIAVARRTCSAAVRR